MQQSIYLTILTLTLLSCNAYKKEETNTNAINSDTCAVQIYWDTITYTLDTCNASYSEEQLQLSFAPKKDTSFPSYDLNVTKAFNDNKILVRQTSMLTDCLYVAAYFKLLNEKLYFQDTIFQKGSKITGTLDLLLLGHKPYLKEPGENKLRTDFDTVWIKGKFTSTIQ